jgi:DNA-binding GntR family transcriptional regulator
VIDVCAKTRSSRGDERSAFSVRSEIVHPYLGNLSTFGELVIRSGRDVRGGLVREPQNPPPTCTNRLPLEGDEVARSRRLGFADQFREFGQD